MTTTGTTIRLFLTDSDPSGLRYAEIGISTILSFVIPRTALKKFGDRVEAVKTAVYFLVGQDENKPGRQKLYIGETEEVYKRLVQHANDRNKDFWEYAIVFVTKDENLNRAFVKFLEALLIETAVKANRVTLVNTREESKNSISEPEKSDVIKLYNQILIISPIFNLNAFEVSEYSPTVPDKKEIVEIQFTIKGSGFDAKGVIRNNKFIIRGGSKANVNEAPTLQNATKQLRQELRETEVLKFNADRTYLEFNQDFAFDYASSASQVVSGSTLSGMDAIRIGNKTYREWIKDQNTDGSVSNIN